MMVKIPKRIQKEILYALTREINSFYTISYLAQQLKSSRVSIWKNIKQLTKMKLIVINSLKQGKSKIYILKPNWKNILLERLLLYYTTLDAQEKEKWQYHFKELEAKSLFIILFGSILGNEKEANDIDILIMSNKKDIYLIEKKILDIQKTTHRKIHLTILTPLEMKEIIKQKNNPITEAIIKGVILYGQDNYIQILKKVAI